MLSCTRWSSRCEKCQHLPRLPLLKPFESYVFEFLVSPTGTSNNSKFHLSRVRHLATELVFYDRDLIPSIKRVQPVATLYAEIVQVIHSFPQFAHSPFWTDIPIIDDGPRTIDESQFTKLLVRKERYLRLDVFKASLATFMTRIAKPDCLGVMSLPAAEDVVEPGTYDPHRKFEHGLHLALAPTLLTLFRQAEIVAHQLAVIEHSRDFEEWPVVEDSWYLEDEVMEEAIRLPGRPFCGIRDLEFHYQDVSVQHARQDPSNEGINQDAVDPTYGCHSSQPQGTTPSSDQDSQDQDHEAGDGDGKGVEGEYSGSGSDGEQPLRKRPRC